MDVLVYLLGHVVTEEELNYCISIDQGCIFFPKIGFFYKMLFEGIEFFYK